jgi:hypothetical protein
MTLNYFLETLEEATPDEIIELAADLNTSHGYALELTAPKDDLIREIKGVDLEDLECSMDAVFEDERGDDD